MAPKKKKGKKKSKAELEEEARLAEEQRRLEEEERLRQEEEERKRREEEERERQRLLKEHTDAETERLAEERKELEIIFNDWAAERRKASVQDAKDAEWSRYKQCTHLPDPAVPAQMNDYFNFIASRQHSKLDVVMPGLEDHVAVQEEAKKVMFQAYQERRFDAMPPYVDYIARLHDTITHDLDTICAVVLQKYDELIDEKPETQVKPEAQVAHRTEHFDLALWINTSKNPRLKSVGFKGIEIELDITKQLALASIALRIGRRASDEFYSACRNEFMAVGGVLYPDVLALPSPPRHINGWSLRGVSSASTMVSKLPYPVPPAGADPATYKAEEEPPPLGFELKMDPGLVLLDDAVQVGWWNAERQEWDLGGINEVWLDRPSGVLKFQTTHLAPLAVLQDRCILLPYYTWGTRPLDGRNGARVELSLDVGISASNLLFHVGPGYVELKAPRLPQLASLLDVAMQPSELLAAMRAKGLHLMPEDRDAPFAEVKLKDRAVEDAMCEDLAGIAFSFLTAHSKWNQAGAADECMCRISEVVDWEEGGRTTAEHHGRIFRREVETGERRVLTVIRRGIKGVAFTGSLNKHEAPTELPGYDTKEYAETIYGEVHASLLTLLRGTAGPLAELEIAKELRAEPSTLEDCRAADPLATQTLGQLLSMLRVFSFGT